MQLNWSLNRHQVNNMTSTIDGHQVVIQLVMEMPRMYHRWIICKPKRLGVPTKHHWEFEYRTLAQLFYDLLRGVLVANSSFATIIEVFWELIAPNLMILLLFWWNLKYWKTNKLKKHVKTWYNSKKSIVRDRSETAKLTKEWARSIEYASQINGGFIGCFKGA